MRPFAQFGHGAQITALFGRAAIKTYAKEAFVQTGNGRTVGALHVDQPKRLPLGQVGQGLPLLTQCGCFVHHDFYTAVLGAPFGVVAAVGVGIGGNGVGGTLAFGLIVFLQPVGD